IATRCACFSRDDTLMPNSLKTRRVVWLESHDFATQRFSRMTPQRSSVYEHGRIKLCSATALLLMLFAPHKNMGYLPSLLAISLRTRWMALVHLLRIQWF